MAVSWVPKVAQHAAPLQEKQDWCRGKNVYGGKLKDLSLVSTQTLTTFVFWLFSGSLLAVGMGEKGLMATRTSTLVVEPFGDLALRML
jgi:hypothetical protein